MKIVNSRKAALFSTAALVLTAGGLATPAGAAEDADVAKQLAAVRAATEQFQDPAAAEAAGYEREDLCVQGPDGVMGLHYIHPELMKPGMSMIAERPPILVYQPKPDGTRALAAVEWFKPDNDQDLSTDEDRPSMFGHEFDGPMEGHSPGMPRHFDLHAWLYKANPGGVFAPWNKAGTCGNEKLAPMPPMPAMAPTADPSHAGHTAAPTATPSAVPAEKAPAEETTQVSRVPSGGANTGAPVRGERTDPMLLGLGALAAVGGAALFLAGRRSLGRSR